MNVMHKIADNEIKSKTFDADPSQSKYGKVQYHAGTGGGLVNLAMQINLPCTIM